MNNTDTDILVKKTISLIDSLNKYVSGLANHSISTPELLTLLSAILAAIISGVSIYVTIRSNKENRESNEKIAAQIQVFENNRAKDTIDANLTANARIEWIQNVRQATAELISACYKYIASNADDRQKDWETAQEKKALYVLYFGPDDDPNEILTNDLFDKKTNKGKNNQIVSFVDKLYLNINHYHEIHSSIERFKKELGKCDSCCHYDEENGEFKGYNCTKDEYGTPFNDDDCEESKRKLNENIKNNQASEQDILRNLQELSEIMRIYGKIEWTRAKKGK